MPSLSVLPSRSGVPSQSGVPLDVDAALRPVVPPPSMAPRLAWPDIAKGIGIVLMYYGHVLACLPEIAGGHGEGAALEEMRFIYAFHMPLFFVLAGFFYRPRPLTVRGLGMLALRRLLPVLFFGLLLLPVWSVGPLLHHSWWPTLAPAVESYLHGHPDLDFVTWFLVCLFVCECLAWLALPWFASPVTRSVFGALCVFAGVALCNHLDVASRLSGVGQDTWFLFEAVVALGLYAIGAAVFAPLQRLAARRRDVWLLACVCLLVAAFTYRLNPLPPSATVMMSTERQGDPLAFAVTALAGSAGVILLAMAIGRHALLQALGRQSLVLLGLSGYFYHFINPRFSQFWPAPTSAGALTLYAIAVASVSLALAWLPSVWLMRWFPWLLGQIGRPASGEPGAHLGGRAIVAARGRSRTPGP